MMRVMSGFWVFTLFLVCFQVQPPLWLNDWERYRQWHIGIIPCWLVIFECQRVGFFNKKVVKKIFGIICVKQSEFKEINCISAQRTQWCRTKLLTPRNYGNWLLFFDVFIYSRRYIFQHLPIYTFIHMGTINSKSEIVRHIIEVCIREHLRNERGSGPFILPYHL